MKQLVGTNIGAYSFDASSGTIAINGWPGNILIEQVLMITNISTNQVIYDFTNSSLGGTISSNIINLNYDTSSMDDTDELQIWIETQDNSEDYNLGIKKTLEQSPNRSRFTDASSLTSSSQTLTTSFADVGGEIDTKGYNTLCFWIKITQGDATDIQFQVLCKHTNGGTDEYNLPIKTISSGVANINPEVIQVSDSDGLYIFYVETNNVIPYIQLQAKETDNGTDAIIYCHYTLGYK